MSGARHGRRARPSGIACVPALIAGSYSLGGQIANDIDPVALNAVRFVIAAVAVYAVVRARGGIPPKAFARRGATSCWAGLFFAIYLS